MSKLTSGQAYVLFAGTGMNVSNCDIPQEVAHELIRRMNLGEEIKDELKALGAAIPAAKTLQKMDDWETLHNRAHAEALEAAANAPLNHAEGFAFILVTPGTSSFAKYLRLHGLSRKSHGGGESYWVRDYENNFAKKKAYADRYAEVVRNGGIKVQVNAVVTSTKPV